jgi:uncharacterized protein YfaT (DUF1175 family)
MHGLVLFFLVAPHQPIDADCDGFPDAAELGLDADRHNFRRWFVAIALSRHLNPQDDVSDCAGLVLYAYREALKEHDESWRREFGELLDSSIPEITAFHYPDIPYIGTDIFRLAQGPYECTDREAGKHLMEYHTVKLTRRLDDQVLPGDLMFFTPRGKQAHVMIYVELKGEPYALYHTGPGGGSSTDAQAGEMRLVKFETLLALNEETWRPDEANPAFAGFYRFKILD